VPQNAEPLSSPNSYPIAAGVVRVIHPLGMTGTEVDHFDTYTWLMPTPVGSVPPDPNDPDLWDWGEFNDDNHPRRRLWHLVLVGIVVLGLVRCTGRGWAEGAGGLSVN
jgi:hypothetical protein